VIDFDRPEQNDWLAVNQFTVVEGQQSRRADIVIFVNGLPLGVVELKNPADEGATVWEAVQQLENYQSLVPAQFTYNAALIASDGVQARIGALGAGKEWFKPWRTVSGREDAAPGLPELQIVLAGVFEQRRFLDLVRHFIVFEDLGGGALAKKIAGYHQFHAVNVAVEETLRAANLAPEAEEAPGTYFARHTPGGEPGDKRVGVVWHTQGSGKSLTMAFYAGRLILHPAMENPTIVVITDRNDLDGNCSRRLRAAAICCAASRSRRTAARICAKSCAAARAASCSRRSRSSCPRKRATATRCCRSGAISW
jgi:type I restriction enzyme R subunit